MIAVRWPELDIIALNSTKLIDEFYYSTDHGLLMAAFIFPISELNKLEDLKMRMEEKRKELSDIEAEIYRVSRDFSKQG